MISPQCYLFGSITRGDADEASDIDVLVIYESQPSVADRKRVKELIGYRLKQDCAIAEYTHNRLITMFEEGHLFAWHLYQEARALQVTGLENKNMSFPKPSPYQSAELDSRNFLELLRSCLIAVKSEAPSLTYEAGLAYVALRNIGMSLSAEFLSRPIFDRWAPFAVAKATTITPPCHLETYDLMVAARHASQRGLSPPAIDPLSLQASLVQACNWSEHMLEVIHDNVIT